MFERKNKKHNIEYWPKKASVAFAIGDLVYADGSGAIQPADSTSGNHIGVILKEVLATDADYALNTMVPIDVADPNDEFIVDVGTGTLTTAMIGTYRDLTDADSINVSAQSKNVVLITGFVSATKAVVKINAMAGVVDVATT